MYVRWWVGGAELKNLDLSGAADATIWSKASRVEESSSTTLVLALAVLERSDLST